MKIQIISHLILLVILRTNGAHILPPMHTTVEMLLVVEMIYNHLLVVEVKSNQLLMVAMHLFQTRTATLTQEQDALRRKLLLAQFHHYLLAHHLNYGQWNRC